VNMQTFHACLSQVPQSFQWIENIVSKRMTWEKLRTEFAVSFPSMKGSLPADAAEMSNYALTMEASMGAAELKVLKDTENDLTCLMRDARAAFRAGFSKVRAVSTSDVDSIATKAKAAGLIEGSRADFATTKVLCEKAVEVAKGIKNAEFEKQARDLISEVELQEKE
jgi:hypothetical protein